MVPTKILKYGGEWPADADPLDIEFECIRRGGTWKIKGVEYGAGLFHHYKEAQKLLWPTGEDHHRWSDLMLKTILEERITVCSGAKDGGKTHVALARFGLTDYFCFPEDTLILMSSTDLRGLQLRVWGDLKDLLRRAKELRPDLPGHVVESKHAVFTDELGEDCNTRDQRRGIICFVSGTPVDTPSGRRPIETIRPGDWVYNAIGVGRVRECYTRIAQEIVRVALSDGRTIECTPEHPFLTRRGWTKAIDLVTSDKVFSAHETMSMLQPTIGSGVPKSKVLFASLSRARNVQELQAMRQAISPVQAERRWNVLFSCLCRSLGSSEILSHPKTRSEVSSLRKDFCWPLQSKILQSIVSATVADKALRRMRENVSIHAAFEDEASETVLRSLLQMEMEQPDNWVETFSSDSARVNPERSIPRCSSASQDFHGKEIWKEYPALLRNRLGVSEIAAWDGNRRRCSPDRSEEGEGQIQDRRVGQAWVESVEILKPGSGPGFDNRQAGYSVHNLSVEGHPSYSVNGVIVHNCIPCLDRSGAWTGGLEKFVGIKQRRRRLLGDEIQFMHKEYLTVLANLDKGNFKGVFCGNALPQKAMDVVAEPEGGWDSHPEPIKTTTWRNKYGGITIALVGTDSPNYDIPAGQPVPYPYLIDRVDEERVAKRHGRDSIEYWSQIKGVRKPGMNAHRVLTKEDCVRFGAFDKCIWAGDDTIKVFGMDAAYGGDRAVGGHVEFGKETPSGQTIIKIHPPQEIPIALSIPETPEEQLAMWAKRYCDQEEIPAENIYFDAGMRATLAVQMSRLISPAVNAVNFGGTATARPMSNDDYIFDDELQEKRLKRCDEAYSKFVTELWFSFRLAVLSRQVRELPDPVAQEFYMREWIYVKGDRYELETKDETKQRMGCSPDLADWCVIATEGCRRLGFVIERMRDPNAPETEEDQWLERELDKHKRFMQQHEMKYA